MEDRNQIIRDKHTEILRKKYKEIDRKYNRTMSFLIICSIIIMFAVIHINEILSIFD